MIGRRFGRLVVAAAAPRAGNRARWSCACDCGAVRVCHASNLLAGRTQSCGCLHQELRLASGTHRQTKTRTYRIWVGMKTRCQNEKCAAFPRYGGRGITVCARWSNDFASFVADMGEAPAGLSIDRIKNDRGYEPGNCRWATAKEQANNRRRPAPGLHRARRSKTTAPTGAAP